MPFKSEAQRRFMHARHPKIAKRWEKHTPKGKKLPKKVKKKKTKKESFELLVDLALELIEDDSTKGASTSVSKGAEFSVQTGSISKSRKRNKTKKPKSKNKTKAL